MALNVTYFLVARITCFLKEEETTTARKYTLQSEHSVVPQTPKMLVCDLKRKGEKKKNKQKRPNLGFSSRLRHDGTFFRINTSPFFVNRFFFR